MLEEEVKTRIMTVLGEMSLGGYVADISLVYGDLSPRRYFRISLATDAPLKTDTNSVIVMYFDSVNPPEAGSAVAKSSYDCFLEVGEFFQKGGIAVPLVYYSSSDLNIIVLEDLGSSPLIELARSKRGDLQRIYEEAVDGIHKIQALKTKDNFFIYKRGFDASIYVREMNELPDYYLADSISKSEKQIIDRAFKKIGEELDSFPQTLVHRDYHSWNLMQDTNGQLRVIDFQDALMGTRSYDLVALVHERDIDSVLGDDLVASLEDYFFTRWEDQRVSEYEYPRVLLQRDLKVAGRFAKVVKTRGLMSYGAWIPGTASRINKTLDRLSDDATCKELKNVLSPYLTLDYAKKKGFV